MRLAVLCLLVLGCKDGGSIDIDGPPPGDFSRALVGTVAEDFSLKDENSTSATAGQQVSPRDYLGGISAWYFGHST